MPLFLEQQDIYRLLQRELPPDDVYPDGSPSGFFSTADQFSTAKVIADAYANDANIYKNYSPITAEENEPDHEFTYFGFTLDGTLSLEDRRALLLKRIRTRLRPTLVDLKSVVYTIIDSSIPVELVDLGCGDAGWILDVSQLDISTILNEFNGLERTGPNLCQLDAADYGLTPEEFARLQAQAYTYEVLIYGYTLTDAQRAQLDQALSQYEAARSQHIILDGLDPNDMISGDT